MHVVAVGTEEIAVTRLGQPRVRRPAGAAQGTTLAGCLSRPENEISLLHRLQQQCRERAPLFAPAREYQAVRHLVADLCEAA